MRVSVETTSGLERRLTVGVPADRVDSAVNKRLKERQGVCVFLVFALERCP